MSNKLQRSNNPLLAGVCGGIAEYFGWDVSMVRIAYALLSVFSAGFPGVLVYVILWMLMPKKHVFK